MAKKIASQILKMIVRVWFFLSYLITTVTLDLINTEKNRNLTKICHRISFSVLEKMSNLMIGVQSINVVHMSRKLEGCEIFPKFVSFNTTLDFLL